ncbi:RidA family protein [Streptomyces sp. NBC_00872]|uniref:RidA family protein n=1 Tax=Streptomyces sp. NBC_00872 TaxID=2903686 RepID=UPI003864AF36
MSELTHLRRCLRAAGVSFADVVELTYFVTDAAHPPAVRETGPGQDGGSGAGRG